MEVGHFFWDKGSIATETGEKHITNYKLDVTKNKFSANKPRNF
jgi:hypothetical protein